MRTGDIKPLSDSDMHHLRAAQGWAELGNHLEADVELDKIVNDYRVHPDVLEVRWAIYESQKHWEACVDIAEAIIGLDIDRATAWIHRSFALHELKRTQEAFERLRPAVEMFPYIWTIPYNMACDSAQLGQLDECEAWFTRAMEIDEHTVKQQAIDDPDLKPFWDSLGGTVWKLL